MVYQMRLNHLVELVKKLVDFQLKGKDKKYRAEFTHTDLNERGLVSYSLQSDF
jgi:hypothetical protein